MSSGIQSDWDIGATLTGAAIGGASGAVGFGVGSYVSGAVGGGAFGAIAGGAAAGAAVGGTSAILYRAAGYNTNIGLAIGVGAAGGLGCGVRSCNAISHLPIFSKSRHSTLSLIRLGRNPQELT
ncbi:MAG: hypothetical protein O2999_08570 [Nitrospirae bacterium]|nr:hypothetical protein [Nitrospirota bacterium]MDA1304337.1 hypothetical protein [Nitrospirota bacterium]